MPTYNFRNKKTDEVITEMMTIAEMQEYLESNPDFEQIIGSPKIVSDRGTNLKVDGGFRESIAKVKETYTVNNIPNY
jgi:hypothetical protein